MATLAEIYDWFMTSKKPTQAQFWASWGSFWNKNESIPQSSISGLTSVLNAKVENDQFNAHKGANDAHAVLFQAKEDKSKKGAPNGYAPLDEFTKLAAQYLNIVNDLVTGGATALLSAEQGKVLQNQVSAINTLLTSDNVDLDTVQELVDAIETVQLSLNTILVNDLTTGGTTKALTAEMGKSLKALIDNCSKKSNFINIIDLGGVGDGITDNTSLINVALQNYREVYFPSGDYLVNNLVNDLGSKITGPGNVKKAITGGMQQLNTGIDLYNYVFGQEYLSFVQSIQLGVDFPQVNPIKVSWAGDSTTFGDGTTSDYNLNNLFSYLAKQKGISNLNSFNRGHSGITTEQWRTNYLSAEIAENPDLYIIRYGINDPALGLSIEDFSTSLRTALDTIRLSKSQAQMSIILMSPNGTSDTPNGRDEKWYEQVRKVYIQAARDYKCAFIDTYSLWLDSRGAAGLYMDDPYTDGRAIHPKNIFNTWIVSKVFELVFPDALLSKISDNNLFNRSSLDGMPVFSDSPAIYDRGITINRAISPDGWEVDGSTVTFYNRDNTGGQFTFSRLSTKPRIFFRAINFDLATASPLIFSESIELLAMGEANKCLVNTDSFNDIFLNMKDLTTHKCFVSDASSIEGHTGFVVLTTTRFQIDYGTQEALFMNGTGRGKLFIRTIEIAWSSWVEK